MASGILIDHNSGQVFWSKNPEAPRPPASLTKILTALMVIDRLNPDDQVTMTREINAVGGATIGAEDGWTISVRDLLSGMLLESGNDAATALAIKASPDGSVAGFVELMNQRAREIGATKSVFVNAHGLDEPGQVSTALDLALISMAAMRNPLFAKIVRARDHEVRWGDGTLKSFQNANRLLTRYPGAVGIKTGYTADSGRNLASAVKSGDDTLMAIALGASDHYAETAELYDWAIPNLDELRAGASLILRPVYRSSTTRLDLRGLEVVEYEPRAARTGPPPMLAPALALLLAGGLGVWLRRRRPAPPPEARHQESSSRDWVEAPQDT
jgi:D-alanyl-D-alanine carboxypeptidase (penicillin-binding protein 5/6)